MWPFKKKSETTKRRAPAPRVVVAPGASRGWQAAENTELLAGWFTTGTPINSEIEKALTALRTRSQDLAKNSDYVRRFFQLAKSNIVGPYGFRLSSKVVKGNGEPDKRARLAIAKAWTRFSKKGVACAQDRLALWEIFNAAIEALFRDGEIILLSYEGEGENEFGISFKLVDPAVLDVNHKGSRERGINPVRMGIETDARGRVTNYHFHSTDTTHETYYKLNGNGFIKVPASRVIHAFITEYPDQIRGIPHVAAAAVRLKKLDRYEDAELTAADVSAATMGFIERGEDGGSFEAAKSVVDGDEDGEYYEVEDPHIETEAGAWHYIENGAKVHTHSPDHPTTAFGPFVKTLLRGAASSLGVSYNSLANDLEGVNLSSLRSGLGEDRELWKAFQEWAILSLVTPMFEKWLEAGLLRNAIYSHDGNPLKATRLEAFREHTFAGKRWPYMDPSKDMDAAGKALNLKIKSPSGIIRDQGDEPEEVWQEYADDVEKLRSLGLEIVDPKTPAKETPNNEEPEDPGEEPGDSPGK